MSKTHRQQKANNILHSNSQQPYAVIVMWLLRITILTLLACTTLLFTHPTYAQASQGEIVTIQILGPDQAPGFSPALVTIHVFDYVVFANHAMPATGYTIASDDGTLSSPVIAPGKQWAITFSNPGTYTYHDTANPPHMVGAIVVVASNVSLLPTPVPGLQSTALALVQSGKVPPDNLSLITPTPTPSTQRAGQVPASFPTSFLSNLWLLTLLLIAESVLLLITFIGSFLLLRSYRHRLRRLLRNNTIDASVPALEKVAVKQGFFHRWRHKNDEDDDIEENYDEEL